MNPTVTPEMLLGALVLLALVLAVFTTVVFFWARAVFGFGRGFQSFNAQRDRNKINVTATFDDGSKRKVQPGFFERMFPSERTVAVEPEDK